MPPERLADIIMETFAAFGCIIGPSLLCLLDVLGVVV